MLTINPLRSTLLVGALMALAGLAHAAEPAMVKDNMLVDSQGMTLYTYDEDGMDSSNCYDRCAKNWPPLEAQTDAMENDDWTVLKRDDGMLQWMYYGKPLYTFIQDKKPGDKLGEGKVDAWHIAKPE